MACIIFFCLLAESLLIFALDLLFGHLFRLDGALLRVVRASSSPGCHQPSWPVRCLLPPTLYPPLRPGRASLSLYGAHPVIYSPLPPFFFTDSFILSFSFCWAFFFFLSLFSISTFRFLDFKSFLLPFSFVRVGLGTWQAVRQQHKQRRGSLLVMASGSSSSSCSSPFFYSLSPPTPVGGQEAQLQLYSRLASQSHVRRTRCRDQVYCCWRQQEKHQLNAETNFVNGTRPNFAFWQIT